jgi:very-short-patch-repair endonuclease
MGYYCGSCDEDITYTEAKISYNEFGKYLCVNCQTKLKNSSSLGYRTRYSNTTRHSRREKPKSTPQALKLIAALRARGIKCEPEGDDNYKHVDIEIEWAGMYIEIDGSQHRYTAKQMYSDIQRDEYSSDDGYVTRRFSNYDIDYHCDKVADAIAEVARRRYKELNGD